MYVNCWSTSVSLFRFGICNGKFVENERQNFENEFICQNDQKCPNHKFANYSHLDFCSPNELSSYPTSREFSNAKTDAKPAKHVLYCVAFGLTPKSSPILSQKFANDLPVFGIFLYLKMCNIISVGSTPITPQMKSHSIDGHSLSMSTFTKYCNGILSKKENFRKNTENRILIIWYIRWTISELKNCEKN